MADASSRCKARDVDMADASGCCEARVGDLHIGGQNCCTFVERS